MRRVPLPPGEALGWQVTASFGKLALTASPAYILSQAETGRSGGNLLRLFVNQVWLGYRYGLALNNRTRRRPALRRSGCRDNRPAPALCLHDKSGDSAPMTITASLCCGLRPGCGTPQLCAFAGGVAARLAARGYRRLPPLHPQHHRRHAFLQCLAYLHGEFQAPVVAYGAHEGNAQQPA